MTHRISYVVVTGFLGAGKTTLLRKLARDLAGRRIAFIVNDLAELDVDGRILEAEIGEAATVTRLSSGCICCTIRGEFEDAMRQIIASHHPEMLIVESSGVTNPQAVLHGLHSPRLRLDSVITVIDAERFLDYMRFSAAVETQVYMADFVLLNKRELVTPEQLAQVEAKVRRFNDTCAVVACSYCQVTPKVLFGAQGGHAAADLADATEDEHLHHLDGDAIESIVVSLPGALVESKLTAFLKSEAVRGVFRAKGFVRIAGEDGLSLFNFVPRRYGLERGVKVPLSSCHGFVVFIGQNVQSNRAILERGLAACV
jgi:G3E family GTPase